MTGRQPAPNYRWLKPFIQLLHQGVSPVLQGLFYNFSFFCAIGDAVDGVNASPPKPLF